mmetsp:Transcript_6994/g.17487  ORF Transcript_6994/g.17487 Transcript_6994/m.17487 type:complete len:446 (-) Transcript_6994:265-1602(-)
MLHLRLHPRARRAEGQDLARGTVGGARASDCGARQRARREHRLLGRWPPAAVQALEHLDEVDRLAAQLVPIVAHHLEEAEDERGLVLPRDGQVHVTPVRARVGDRGVAHSSERVGRSVHVLLDDRVLDVRPEARVGEVGLPLGHQVVARAVRGRLGALVHKVRDVAPRELGDAELEAGRGREEHLPALGADRHNHVDVLEGEARLGVDDGADLVRVDQEAMVLDEVCLRALLVVAAAVERAPQGMVVPHRHALRRVVLDQAQVGLGGVGGEGAVGLGLEEHGRCEGVVARGLVPLPRLERLDELAAEERVERVAVVVQQQAVLGLDVRHRVEPALHRARAQRQRDLGHSPPVLELRREVDRRARLEVRVGVDEVDRGGGEALEAGEEAGQLRARVLHRDDDRHLVRQHLLRARRVLGLHRGRHLREGAVARHDDERHEEADLVHE